MHVALSSKISQIARMDEASKARTCYMCTKTEPIKIFFTCLHRYPDVPVTKDQLRLYCNPASSEETCSPSDQNKVPTQVNFFHDLQCACTLKSPPRLCVWETAWGVLWVCESVSERERVRGGRGRVCAAAEGTENQYSECTEGECGGSDVAGIITGWQSIWNIWDRGSSPTVPLNTGHLLDVAVTPLSIGAHVPSIGRSLRSAPGPWWGWPAWGFGPVAAEVQSGEMLHMDLFIQYITMSRFS